MLDQAKIHTLLVSCLSAHEDLLSRVGATGLEVHAVSCAIQKYLERCTATIIAYGEPDEARAARQIGFTAADELADVVLKTQMGDMQKNPGS